MVTFGRFSARILIFICIFSCCSVYLLVKLRVEEDVMTACGWCRTMGFESVGKDVDLPDETTEETLSSFEMPTYVKQIDIMENGSSVLHHDQFVIRGLAELSLIRKSINNIFFVESSCVLSKQDNYSVKFVLDTQHACGVESTARANPDRPVYVLHSCPLAEDFVLRVPEYARALLELHNVFVVALDLAELSKGWSDPLPFTSTSLGLLALWRFGGTYCDLDTLALRSLRPLGTNYCAYRDDNLLVGDQLLNFEPLGYGHTVVTQILKNLSNIINKQIWTEKETYLTQFVIDQCSQLPKYKEDCNKLTIYDSTVLFTAPTGFTDATRFVSKNLVDEFVDEVKSSAYIINYFSRLYSFSEDKKPTQAFMNLAKEFCPNVYTRFNHRL